MYRLAKIEWDGPAATGVAQLIGRALRALVRPACKCLVVDLDNTLWGGVVGEDGPRGINLAEGDPAGESFLAFQRALLDLKAQGVLLAICSKNNREDAEEAFEISQMPLRLTDFAATRINWANKHENILGIAQELNIGTDSMVFVDDNPAECELVRQMLPEVTTLQLPRDPAEYVDTLTRLPNFDKLVITDEDLRKTELYRENAARMEKRAQIVDLVGYLESLGTKLQFANASLENLVRIHQLFSKTNQFNCTTKRYTPAEIEEFIESDDWLLEFVKAEDNFGDLGVIGIYLVRLEKEKSEIDSFILSCRAMGRGIESAMCNRIKDHIFKKPGAKELLASFVPTQKNSPAVDFFESQAFEVIDVSRDGAKQYRLFRNNCKPVYCPGIHICGESEPE